MTRVAVLLSLAALLLVGCGTAEVNLHTTVRESGDVGQDVTVRATGALGGILKDSMGGRAQRNGWRLTVDDQGQAAVLHAEKTFKYGESLAPLALVDADGTTSHPGSVLQENSFFYRRYTVRVPISSGQIADAVTAQTLGAQSTEAIKSAIAQDMKLTWSITMPGEIESSNADSVTRDTASWTISPDKPPANNELLVSSRSLKSGSILILISTGALIALIALTYLTIVKRHDREDHAGHIRIRI